MAGVRYSLRQLEYVVSVSEMGSISAAALALHMSESAVAVGLRELENALGVQLCIRRKARGIQLTPAGREVTQRARRLLRDAEALQVSSDSGAPAGAVRLGSPNGIAPSVVPSLLAAAQIALPQVRLDIVLGDQQELTTRLSSADIDLALLPTVRLDLELATRDLFDAPVHALVSSDHPLADAEAVSLRQLRDEPFIMLDTSPAVEHALELLTAAGIVPDIRHRTTNLELVRAFVGRGWGYSLLTVRPVVDRTYEGRRVVALPLEEAPDRDAIVIAWRREITPTPAAEAIADLAVRLWQNNPSPLGIRV
ncbi:LysR family transcriptional regulator [Microbacterium rhizophilus]|uniref:LysR family transcriptional regulator n=1 Tax=Microbacterium rhizophilus TaxID=3138934 RepID=UPI0031E62755